MTVRRASAYIAGVLLVMQLTACADPEPTEANYRATHVGFWTVAAEVGEDELGETPREDLESYLDEQWKNQSEQATWRAVYDGVCDELREDEAPDLILGLVDQLQQRGISTDAARSGVIKQVQVIVDNLCPSHADAVEDLRDELAAD